MKRLSNCKTKCVRCLSWTFTYVRGTTARTPAVVPGMASQTPNCNILRSNNTRMQTVAKKVKLPFVDESVM